LKQERNENLSNYNFEQYKDFTRVHKREMNKLKENEETVKKMMRYITLNPDNNISDHFLAKLGITLDDVVDHPEVDISDFSHDKSRRHRR